MMYTAVAFLPVTLFIVSQRKYFVFPADLATFGWFILSMMLTGLLQFFTSYTMALLAFWLLEISTFIFIVFAFEYIAGGHLFPLDILPAGVAAALNFTPFPYQLFFPVSLYLGRITGAAVWQGLAIQLFWVLFFYLVARWTWRRGIRKYTAFGG